MSLAQKTLKFTQMKKKVDVYSTLWLVEFDPLCRSVSFAAAIITDSRKRTQLLVAFWGSEFVCMFSKGAVAWSLSQATENLQKLEPHNLTGYGSERVN